MKYLNNWKEIRENILKRAENRCELCFSPNNHLGFRSEIGIFLPMYDLYIYENDEIELRKWIVNEFESEPIKIVLTIHHIDGNINNNDKHNLIALCQRCYLRLDLPYKLKKRRSK